MAAQILISLQANNQIGIQIQDADPLAALKMLHGAIGAVLQQMPIPEPVGIVLAQQIPEFVKG